MNALLRVVQMARKSTKAQYDQLIELIEDYVTNMHRINSKRSELMNKDVEYIRQEFKLFNLLQNNIKTLEEANGIPKD